MRRRTLHTDQQNLPVTATPTIDAFVTVRPQIIFFQQNYFDEIGSTPTYVANTIYPAPSFANLSVTVHIKHSATDCQIVLVNMARALNYLEDFGQRQSQLFKVLEKYHLLPDNFENLQLQFGFLKQTTSKNIEHLQQTINVQQTCTATICMYINSILLRITKLEQTIIQLQQNITTEPDTVQINAPDFDPDIDGPQPPRGHTNTVVVSVQEHFPSPEPEVLVLQNHKQKMIQQKSHPTLYTTILKSPMGMKISP